MSAPATPSKARAVVGWLNDVVRLLLEVAIGLAVAWWAWSTPDSLVLSIFGVVVLPLAIVVTWGLFGAPRRSMFQDNRWLPVGLLWFLAALASLALVDLGRPVLAVVLFVLVIVNDLLIQLGLHSPHRPVA